LRWRRPSRPAGSFAWPSRPVRSSSPAAALLRRHEHVLEDRHVLERPRHLVRASDAQPAPDGRVQTRDRRPVEHHLAAVLPEVPGDQAEEAGLPRAVRTDDADGVTGAHRHGQVVGDDDAPEPLGEVVELEQRSHDASGVRWLERSAE
jgi:hypothetical protein